ncbi:MAG: 4Fe-4S binding protein [Rhodovibrio sp.]|nr:4Fe-4S binding protein [Rhodovibrio sp.]
MGASDRGAAGSEPVPESTRPPHFRKEACLPWRSPLSGCRLCAEACPVDALLPDGNGWTVADHCLGCGQCAAVCPTGALDAPGFEEAAAPETAAPERQQAAVVDCYRVPSGIDGQAVRVPCTGGLDLAHVLALHDGAGGRGPVVRDRGWCAECPVGGARHPAASVITRARDVLAAFGVAAVDLPRLERVVTSETRARPAITSSAAERSIGRRALLRGLASAAHRHEPREGSTSTGTAAAPLDAATRPPRERLVAALQARGGLPPSLTPQIMVSSACQDHGVCAAICPTDAIYRTETNTVTAWRSIQNAASPVACVNAPARRRRSSWSLKVEMHTCSR